MSEVVVAEECRENFRLSRGNYLGLNVLLTGACSKRDKAVVPPIKRCSVDAEHIICFHVWTENFCSFFAPKVAFSNLSGIVWTRRQPCSSDRLHNVAVKLTQASTGIFVGCKLNLKKFPLKIKLPQVFFKQTD